MAYAYTTDEFLSDLIKSARLPDGDNNYTNDDLLHMADDEVQNSLAPLLKSLDEGFYIEPFFGSFSVGQADYSIPRYAMWNAIYRVDLVENGNFRILYRIEPDELSQYDQNATGVPARFYPKHDVITFLPTPAAGVSVSYCMYIWRRPGAMVQTSAAAKVQSVNYATGQVTYTAIPPTTFTSSSVHDFYSSVSPFRRIGTAVQATALAANVQTFPIASVATLQAGDYVCMLDETVFLPIPIELKSFLRDLVIKQIAQDSVDAEKYQMQRAEILERAKTAMKAPGQRIFAQPKTMKVTQSPLLWGRRRWW